MFYGVQKIVPRRFIFIASLVSLAGGWFLYINHIRLPLGIERDLTVLFFFANGWLCKGAVQSYSGKNTMQSFSGKKSRGAKNILTLIAAAIISFIAYAYIEIPDPNFSIMNNDLGKDFRIFVASSFFGIAGLVTTFILADKLPNIVPIRIFKGILRNISRNALIILAIHWYILLVLRVVFKAQIDRPGIAYLSAFIVIAGVIAAIPLFRCKLYKLLGKERVSMRESLRIRD